VDFGSASARLAMRFIRLVIGWSTGDSSETARRHFGEEAIEEPRRGVVQGEGRMGYSGERVGSCAARQELPVLEGKACPGDTSCHLSVLSFK
jgi:hypothetical protein